MKKLLLTSVILFSVLFLKAQCTPDTSISSPGIYPDQTTNLDEAFVGQPYVTQIDVLTPLDTSVSLSGLNVNVTIDNIELTSVSGLPNNFSYSCNPPTCIFPGGAYACAEIFSTVDPTSSDVGYYPLIMTTSTLAINVPLIGSITQLDTVDYFYIDISNTSSSIEQIYSSTLKIMDVYPNPISDNATFQFAIGKNESVDFYIVDCLGKVVDSRKIQANMGINKFNIDFSNYSNGIYSYNFKTSDKIIAKKLLVTNK